MQVLVSQWHFLANRNAELAVPPLFWPVNSIRIGGHVALLSCPSIYFLFYGLGLRDHYSELLSTSCLLVLTHRYDVNVVNGHADTGIIFRALLY